MRTAGILTLGKQLVEDAVKALDNAFEDID